MEAELEILSGVHMNTRVSVRLGQTITVGRTAPADVILDEDPSLSNPHFSLRVDDLGCWLTDLSSHYGTLLNGRRVDEAFAPDGSTIAAGSTTFLLFVTRKGAPVNYFPEAFHDGGKPPPVPVI